MAKPKTTFVSSRIPLYYQLENVLREKITSGTFTGGERLPTEIELIEQYGVSRITVRQALSALAEEGLIDRKQGRGTFVIEASDQSDVERFVTLVADGRKLKAEVTALTSAASTADAEAANRLAIPATPPCPATTTSL